MVHVTHGARAAAKLDHSPSEAHAEHVSAVVSLSPPLLCFSPCPASLDSMRKENRVLRALQVRLGTGIVTH